MQVRKKIECKAGKSNVRYVKYYVDLQHSGKSDLVSRFERKLSGKLEKATYVM
jgi:hypothetical protein